MFSLLFVIVINVFIVIVRVIKIYIVRLRVHNHLKRTGQLLEFRPEERVGLVNRRIHRWIMLCDGCIITL